MNTVAAMPHPKEMRPHTLRHFFVVSADNGLLLSIPLTFLIQLFISETFVLQKNCM